MRQALGLLDALESKVCSAIGVFDASCAYDGYTAAMAWLRSHGRLTCARASSFVKTARRLRKLPVTEKAWSTGDLSGSQVQAVVANIADDASADLFAEHETEVVPALI